MTLIPRTKLQMITPMTIPACNKGLQPSTDKYSGSTAESSLGNARQILFNQGVLHLPNLTAPADIRLIKSELDQLFGNFQQLPKQLAPKVASSSKGDIREIANLVSHSQIFRQSAVYQKCHQLASEIFGRQCRYGFDHAIYKSPGSTAVHWHQDQYYSNLDRDKQCISFWIPLQSVTPANGGMQYAVLPTADAQLLRHTRVTPDSFMFHVAEEQVAGLKTISPAMNVGDVCLHTPLTLHRSHPNNGPDTRCAWILQFNKYGPLRFGRWVNIRRQAARLFPSGKLSGHPH